MLILSFAVSAFATDGTEYCKIYYGDLNLDESINADDALVVLNHAARLQLIDYDLLVRADVTGNQTTDASDALEILKYAAGLINEFSGISDMDVTYEPTEIPTESPTPKPTFIPMEQPTERGDIEMPEDFSGTVWIMGDSIAANHEKTASVRPLHGWGELIGEYFTGVDFRNHAISSQSTSSYYNLNKTTYNYVFNFMKEKDYAIISFGHNDHNSALLDGFDRTTDAEASTDTQNSYKWWLKNYYIDPVLEKGAIPILMSSVVRCVYIDGVFSEFDIHMKYGAAMEELVEEYAAEGITVYYIDAQDYTYNLYSTLTREEASLYHGQYGTEASFYFDNTHFSEAGARMIIEYMISELKKTDLSIVQLCKE